MSKKNKLLFLSLLTSLIILTGCSDKKNNNNTKEIDNSDNDIQTVYPEEVVYEDMVVHYTAGTHFVRYEDYRYVKDIYRTYNSTKSKYEYKPEMNHFDVSYIPVIDNYEFVDVEPITYNGSTIGYSYIFVNTVDVNVTLSYDANSGIYKYSEPGVPVEDTGLILK